MEARDEDSFLLQCVVRWTLVECRRVGGRTGIDECRCVSLRVVACLFGRTTACYQV